MASEKSQMKKRVYYVPSRYKQAAEKCVNQSGSSKDSSSTFRSIKEGQKLDFTTLEESTNLKCDDKESKSKDFASTPLTETRMKLVSLDASVITNRTALSDGKSSTQSTEFRRKRGHFSDTTLCKGSKPSDRANKNLAEAEIDILYAQYLQAAFLESQTKKTLELRSECAFKKIDKVWHLIQQYLLTFEQTKKSVNVLSYFIKQHEHLTEQEKMLNNILDVLPLLEKKYKILVDAIDQVRHKLPIKDVLLFDSSCEESLSQEIQKMGDYLTDFIQATASINDFATVVDEFQTTTKDCMMVAEEIKSSVQILNEVRDLLLSEACFKLELKSSEL